MAQSTKKVDAGRKPGPIEIPNGVEVIWYFSMPNTRKAHCITHADGGGTYIPSVVAADTLFGFILTNWGVQIAPYCATDFSFDAISVRDMTFADNPGYLSSIDGESGTSLSTAMPPQTAVVLSGKAPKRGKGFTARIYLPGWATNAAGIGGIIEAAALTSIRNFAQTLASVYTNAGLAIAIAHPERLEYTGLTGTVHPARPAEMVDVTGFTVVDNVFDTVRSRVKP